MHIAHINCGGQLLMESIFREGKFITEFFNPQVKDHAEKVTCCPHCGEPLGRLLQQSDMAQANRGLHLS